MVNDCSFAVPLKISGNGIAGLDMCGYKFSQLFYRNIVIFVQHTLFCSIVNVGTFSDVFVQFLSNN